MVDRRAEVSKQLHGVENGVKHNIDLALDVHEDLEIVEDQAANLAESGNVLHKKAKTVRQNMCCRACATRQAKYLLILGLIAGVVLIIMVALGYAGAFKKER